MVYNMVFQHTERILALLDISKPPLLWVTLAWQLSSRLYAQDRTRC
jgi:hypothetical protein